MRGNDLSALVAAAAVVGLGYWAWNTYGGKSRQQGLQIAALNAAGAGTAAQRAAAVFGGPSSVPLLTSSVPGVIPLDDPRSVPAELPGGGGSGAGW